MKHEQPDEPDDLVLVLLQRVAAMAPEFSQALAEQLEQEMRQQFGGRRVFIPKRKKHLKPQQREQLKQDGLSSMSDKEILAKHGVSRATFYRQMKRDTSR